MRRESYVASLEKQISTLKDDIDKVRYSQNITTDSYFKIRDLESKLAQSTSEGMQLKQLVEEKDYFIREYELKLTHIYSQQS